MPNNLSRSCVPSLLLCSAFLGCAALLAGCQSSGGAAGMSPDTKENAIVHTTTAADLAATQSKEPLQGSGAILWVSGLGCPQCASNIDLQLKRIPGLTLIRPDLSTGKVDVSFTGRSRPSAYTLSEAVHDAGFTLVKIEGK